MFIPFGENTNSPCEVSDEFSQEFDSPSSSSSSSGESESRSISSSVASSNVFDDFENFAFDSSSDGGSGSEAGPSDHQDAVTLLTAALQGKARTSKARSAAIFSKAIRKLAKSVELGPAPHPADSWRADIQFDTGLNKPGQCAPTARNRRLRLLVSYMKAWCSSVVTFFSSLIVRGDSEQAQPTTVRHTIVCAIVDDTNMKLSSSVLPGWIVSRTVAVMNIIQSMVVSHGQSDHASRTSKPECSGECVIGGAQTKTFNIHTPLICLPRSDRETLAREFMSRLVLFLGRVSKRLESFGLLVNFAAQVPIQALAVCMDALATNLAVIKQMRSAIVAQHKSREPWQENPVYPLFQVSCLIHQLALSRRVALNGFPQFYSSIVRLAHLFEVGTFRLQFRKALIAVICDSFQYAPVPEHPQELAQWKARRNEICSISAHVPSRRGRKRIQLHRSLMQYDNGDPEANVIQHFCIGACCEGQGHSAKSEHCKLMICKFLTLLFSFGYPVPLTYRWLHCHRALQFCRDAWNYLGLDFFDS